MSVTTPPTITTLPAAPSPTQAQEDFDNAAYTWSAALPQFRTEIGAVATNVYSNATAAEAAAIAAETAKTGAESSALLASEWATKTGSPVAAGEYSAKHHAQQAANSAAGAATARAEAEALVEKYQGALGADPTLDKTGGPITAGDWYIHSPSGFIRAYDGVSWVNSVNVTAGVSSLNGQQGGLTLKTVNGLGLLGSGGITVGDVAGPTSSVDNEIVLFSGTGGKTIKRATGSGLAKLTGGVLSTASAGVDYQSPIGTISGIAKGNGANALTAATAGTDYAKPDTASSWTAEQTFKEVKDTVFTITDAAGFQIDPANGSIQTITLGASRTPAATNFESGQAVLLGIDDGAAYSITWTTVNPTWVKAGGGGSAPTLATTGFTWVLLWKVGSVIYASEVGKP